MSYLINYPQCGEMHRRRLPRCRGEAFLASDALTDPQASRFLEASASSRSMPRRQAPKVLARTLLVFSFFLFVTCLSIPRSLIRTQPWHRSFSIDLANNILQLTRCVSACILCFSYPLGLSRSGRSVLYVLTPGSRQFQLWAFFPLLVADGPLCTLFYSNFGIFLCSAL